MKTQRLSFSLCLALCLMSSVNIQHGGSLPKQVLDQRKTHHEANFENGVDAIIN